MKRTLGWALPGALWLLFLSAAFVMIRYSTFALIDFRVYYDAAHMLAEGISPYSGAQGMVYLYPPLVAQFLIPLATHAEYGPAALIWTGLNMLLIVCTAGLLSRHVRARDRWYVWALPAVSGAFLSAIVLGQITLIMLFLFTIAWSAQRSNNAVIAGAALALLTWIKLYPVVVILYYLWKRDYRIVLSALVAGVILLGMQIMLSGAELFQAMLPTLLTLLSSGQAHNLAGNSSILGVVTQLFEQGPDVLPLVVSPQLALVARVLLSGILLIGLLGATRPRAQQSQERLDLEFALAVLTALLLSPTLWVSGMTPMLLVYVLLWRSHPAGRNRRYMTAFCLLAPLLLTIYYVFITGYTANPPASALTLSFGFCTLIATWGVIMLRLRTREASDQRRNSSAA